MKRKIVCLFFSLMLAAETMACGNNTAEETDKEITEESTEDSYLYNISALLSADNTYNQNLLKGFSDALTDYLGNEHISINVTSAGGDASMDELADGVIAGGPDLIFTAGKAALMSVHGRTSEIPIVATDIVDFKGTLRIASLNGASWDKTTGTNVTGVSSKPSIVDQVSLMIEATEDLQTVGIFFSPEDTDAIYQNEIFEAYLDQAGIPWKEYLIPASSPDLQINEEQPSTALTPSKFVASSAKAGMDNSVISLTDGGVGLNSPSSTRVALVSDNWTGGKILPVAKTDDTTDENTDESSDADSDSDDEDAEIDLSSLSDEEFLEYLTKEACQECSAIYIPFGSMLTDEMELIGSTALENSVTVVAGDTDIGENALVTLFYDPYALGYAAGKKAVRVFNGDDISKITIGSGSSDGSIKLYNGQAAEALGLEFPKSFSEINEFLNTYEYGSTTARHVASED